MRLDINQSVVFLCLFGEDSVNSELELTGIKLIFSLNTPAFSYEIKKLVIGCVDI